MKAYRTIISGFAVLCAVIALARWAQIWPAAAAQRTGNQSAESQSSPRQTGFFGVQAGPSGPATELLKLMGVNQTDFGIKVVQTFDARGKPAYETKGGDLLFFTNASVSYNSTADHPMVIVINAKTRKIIAERSQMRGKRSTESTLARKRHKNAEKAAVLRKLLQKSGKK